MTSLSVFQFQPSFEVRVIMIDSAPWFVAADVAAALDYTAAPQMTRNLDDDEKGMQIVHTLGGQQEMLIINESGLYSAILKSRKPEAKKFKKWVTSEVLPTIRKTGSYSLPKPVDKRDYMTNSDMLNIKRLIYKLSGGMNHKNSCSQAIWAALREVTGVPSPAKFEAQHVPVVAHELQRIYGVIHAYVETRRDIEQELIKRIIRNRDDAQKLLPILLGMMSATIESERCEVRKEWREMFGRDHQNLLNRVPNYYDHHEYSEQHLI